MYPNIIIKFIFIKKLTIFLLHLVFTFTRTRTFFNNNNIHFAVKACFFLSQIHANYYGNRVRYSWCVHKIDSEINVQCVCVWFLCNFCVCDVMCTR